MKRILKILLALMIVASLLIVGAVWAFFTFFPQAKMREYAAQAIGAKIHRQVLFGPIRLGWNGLQLETLKISEIPSFKSGTLLEADGVHLGWNLRSIWKSLSLRRGSISQSSGQFTVQEFRHQHYNAKDMSLDWSLHGIDSGTPNLSGWLKLRQGPGTLRNIDQLVQRSPSLRATFTPVIALMNLERAGILNLGLPDLSHWPLDSIQGDYTFDQGLMTIRQFEMKSPALDMNTSGTVELSSGKLLLEAKIHTPNTAKSGSLDASFAIGGTTAKPVVDLSNLKKKMIRANITDLLKDPAKAKDKLNQTLKNLF